MEIPTGYTLVPDELYLRMQALLLASMRAPVHQLKLISFGDRKISVIKAIRAITRLGLREAKEMTESAPILVAEFATLENALQARDALGVAGATVEIR